MPEQQRGDHSHIGEPGGDAQAVAGVASCAAPAVPDRRSRTASATIAITTESPPRAITAFLSIVGATMNLVSISMRAEIPAAQAVSGQ